VRVLGLDPGSRRTGYGVVERSGNKDRVIAFGAVAPPARLDLAQRLHAIAKRAGDLMDAHAPEAVVVEEAFYHESVRSTLVLGHVRGALLVAAAGRNIPVAEYTPREIKLSVVGSGGASKEQVQFMVRRLLGIRGALAPDAADALAAAVCHLNRAQRSAPLRAASAVARKLEQLLARKTGR